MATECNASGTVADQYSDLSCVICMLEINGAEERLISTRRDGRQTIIRFSALHENHAPRDYFASNPLVVKVHKSCQCKFADEMFILKKVEMFILKKVPEQEVPGKFL